MQANVGSADRMIRIVLGLAIIVVGIVTKSWWGAIGLLPILTGVLRCCPAYMPFGLSTCKVKKA